MLCSASTSSCQSNRTKPIAATVLKRAKYQRALAQSPYDAQLTPPRTVGDMFFTWYTTSSSGVARAPGEGGGGGSGTYGRTGAASTRRRRRNAAFSGSGSFPSNFGHVSRVNRSSLTRFMVSTMRHQCSTTTGGAGEFRGLRHLTSGHNVRAGAARQPRTFTAEIPMMIATAGKTGDSQRRSSC